MGKVIRVAVLDDHPVVIDGYRMRLERETDISLVASALFGADLEPMLARQSADVLILDIEVPVSAENANPYPVLYMIPRLLEHYPDLAILIFSMHKDRTLIRSVMDNGASGYILKDDLASLQQLAAILRTVAAGGIHLSARAYDAIRRRPTGDLSDSLSPRQVQALSLCAAYPDESTAKLANSMNIESSSLRNLLSGAYLKLGVNTRAAAILKARQLGLITPHHDAPPEVYGG